MDSKVKENHQFHEQTFKSILSFIQVKLLKCVNNFALVKDFQRLYTSNLGELSRTFTSLG